MSDNMNMNTMVGKVVAVLVALLLVVVLVYPVINTVGNGGSDTTTITSINEGAEWLKLGYAEGTDFEFEITDDGADVTVGEQTGSLGDMIYYADEGRVIFSRGTATYLMTTGNDSAVYTFSDSVRVTNANGTLTIYDGSSVIDTVSSPAWAYYPDSQGGYGFFTNGNLNLLENEPKVAVGSYAGVFAYNDVILTPNGIELGLVKEGDYADGEVVWEVPTEDSLPTDSQPNIAIWSSVPVMNSANPTNSTRIGDLYYRFSGSNASLVGYSSSINWSTFTTIPDTVTYGGTTYTVNAIGVNAFKDCTNLALTSLPSGLTSIKNYAFQGCTNLALTSLPSGVTSIGSGAFSGCTSLALTSLPNGLTTINDFAFQDCTSLALTSLPSGITYIYMSTFQNCPNLALTSLPSGITWIEGSAFQGCTNLALTSLPSGVKSIGSGAFSGCTSLALTSLPSGVTSINSYTFRGCTNLETMIIIGSPRISDDAFLDTNIKEVLNLGDTAITTTSYGLNADSVQDYVGALGYVAPTHIQEDSSDSSGNNADGVFMAVLKIVPIVLIICILSVLVMPMINGKAQ